REFAFLEIDIVLHPDARMAAEPDSLRHHRELHERDAEGEPGTARRKQVAHVGHGLGCRRLAPGDAKADLEQTRTFHQAVGEELLRQKKMARLEHLELWRDA